MSTCLRLLVILLTISFLAIPSWAQLGNTSQNQSSLQWSQKRTPHFRLIYPKGYDSLSNHLANTLETVYDPVAKTLGRRPRPISLVLQTQTTVSNGFVTLMPRHTEFYITPPQDANFLGNNRWLDLLAVHEFRHVVQYEKAMTGLSKALFYAFGYNATSFINLGVPDWFSEGDAVCTETALTAGGRGRIPEFNLLQRTQLLSRPKPFSYFKAVAGSYKDNVPDWYVLGYQLTNYTRRTFGPEVWDQALNKYYRFPFYPFSFSDKLRKTTKVGVEGLYRLANEDFKKQWSEQQPRNLTPVDYQSALPKVYTDYQFPQYLPDGRLIALKSGLANIPAFVRLDTLKEETLFETGYLNNSATLSFGTHTLVWAEQHFDPRWGMRDYTVLKTLHTQTGKLNKLSSLSRYFAPSISPDDSRIITVEVDTQGKSQLVLLDASTGQVLQVFPNPDQAFYQQPRFSTDGQQVVVTKQIGRKKTFEIVTLANGSTQEVFTPLIQNIAQPLLHQNWLIYNAPYTGIDQIYAYHLTTKKTYQVTRRPFGAYHAALSPDRKTLAFQDFGEKGFRIGTMPFDPSHWPEIQEIPAAPDRSFGPLVQQENNASILSKVPGQDYPTRSYSKANLFNIYHWGPTFSSSITDLNVGIESQNLISTAFTSAGYTYNAAERQGQWYGNFSYYGWYPVLDVSVSSGSRATRYALDRQAPLDSTGVDRWRQNDLNVGLRLPLTFTHSKYREGLSMAVYGNFIQTKGYDLWVRNRNEPGSNNLAATTVSFAYNRLLRQSKRDVQPRWGQTFLAYARNTPFGGTLQGNLLALQTRLYFPGFAKHHSLRVFGGIQFQGSSDTYVFSSPLFFPRGYAYENAQRLTTGSIQYQLPLLYPDLAIGPLLYIQRVKLNAFVDGGHALIPVRNNGLRDRYYGSAGLDIIFDFNLLRFRQPLELGFRQVITQERRYSAQLLVVDIGF
ncbi:hypothetical protein BWI96_01060 [Siphonobacter sp. SORGH_AS_0500]|uniref:hypothetical protein n=1 Tax=Siphonobacter sp. SORGH_AS_0500 TaxID=1864824 RepID=UPI000CBA57A3|nr:hypothetical protein [Siphonobacter sp. SORGH_AS_0500]PKK38398.1 hypothetical protein BWI96_01060 [Siphonobacter sp. SORGH_AS_0500]